MPIRYTKRSHFNQLSRNNRKKSFMRIKSRIQRAVPVLGGKFITNCFMHGQNEWLDAHFIGTQPLATYSLSIQTVRSEYKELVQDRVWDSSYELSPDRDFLLNDDLRKDPTTGEYINRREPVRYAELDNMTRLDWAQAQYKKIADSGEIQVFEKWTLHHDYHNSIGLHATIDVPYLSIKAVNAFIDRFLITETNFLDTTPHTYRYEQLGHWGLNANALIDPWDWAEALKSQPGEEA